MTTETSIEAAISRSISHNEIVCVIVRSTDAMIKAVGDIYRLATVEDHDYTHENDGSVDAWGTTTSGDEFRIRISKA